MKKVLMAFSLVLLSACKDSNLERVRSMPVSVNDKSLLGAVLDPRAVCDKTTWTETAAEEKGGEARVDYQCVLSSTQTQAFFDVPG